MYWACEERWAYHRAGVERISRVGSDGCTVSVTVLPEKKEDILMSRGVSCIVLSGPPSPTGPAPAGRRNLQNLRATSQIYRKFRAPPTLHLFTRKNRHFTHFTALYTGFRPLSGLHTHVAHRSLTYLGAYRFFGTSRACCPLPVHSPPLL